MATLSKHGEIGQIDRLYYRLAYCADGKILRNNGDGWKCWKKLVEGLDPVSHFHEQKVKFEAKLHDNPQFRHWYDLVHGFPFRFRWMVAETVRLMPEDADGVYSELDDFFSLGGDGHPLSLEDAVDLCEAYRAATIEAQEAKKAREQSAVEAPTA